MPVGQVALDHEAFTHIVCSSLDRLRAVGTVQLEVAHTGNPQVVAHDAHLIILQHTRPVTGHFALEMLQPLHLEVAARECRDLINGVMNDVAQHGLPEDRLATVKQYLKKVHAEDVADNSYWMVMLKNLDKFGINFDRNYLETLDAITVADIQRFVQQLLAGSRLELQMTPEKAGDFAN